MVKRAKVKKPSTPTEEVLYPEETSEICKGSNAMTADRAKELLGWQEEPKGEDWGTDYQFRDTRNKKIRCSNNSTNRSFDPPLANRYMGQVLRKRWKLNGESMIISRTGKTLACQHRLAGLVFAVQKWEDAPEDYPLWDSEPTLDTYLSLGISDDDETVNTIDTGRARSLTDVIYRSPYFQDQNKSVRQYCSRMIDHAVQKLWERTGVRASGELGHQTHPESIAFLERHPKLFECVRLIYDLNGGKGSRKISEWISPGYAAAMLYLMGSSTSDGKTYRQSGRDETTLDWSMWDEAVGFWFKFSERDSKMLGLFEVFAWVADPAHGGGGRNIEKLTSIVKTWDCLRAGDKATFDRVKPRYVTDDNTGLSRVKGVHSVGGIDLFNTDAAREVLELEAQADDVEEGEGDEESPPYESDDEFVNPTELLTSRTEMAALRRKHRAERNGSTGK